MPLEIATKTDMYSRTPMILSV